MKKKAGNCSMTETGLSKQRRKQTGSGSWTVEGSDDDQVLTMAGISAVINWIVSESMDEFFVIPIVELKRQCAAGES